MRPLRKQPPTLGGMLERRRMASKGMRYEDGGLNGDKKAKGPRSLREAEIVYVSPGGIGATGDGLQRTADLNSQYFEVDGYPVSARDLIGMYMDEGLSQRDALEQVGALANSPRYTRNTLGDPRVPGVSQSPTPYAVSPGWRDSVAGFRKQASAYRQQAESMPNSARSQELIRRAEELEDRAFKAEGSPGQTFKHTAQSGMGERPKLDMGTLLSALTQYGR